MSTPSDPGPDAAASAAPYQVVARRFRPRRFEELVGQEAVVRSLGSALSAGRVPHAFLFSGSRGVGKTTSARILARALNCERGVGPAPCGECATCRSILAGSNPDVVEIDAASHNLVDDVRELCERVGVASMGSRYKVYILDEVHMFTRNAFNAFLKTLEEPPRNVVFVLATTELHKVPETVRSRCQVVLFRRIDERDVTERLRDLCAHEAVDVADDVLQEIALACRGGMRDAETSLERILPLARETKGTFGVADYRRLTQRVGLDRAVDVALSLCAGSANEALHFAEEVVGSGVDEREALGELLDVLRNLLLLKIDGDASGLVALGGALRERLIALARETEVHRLDAMIQAGLAARDRIRRAEDRRLVLELALVRMAQAGSLPTLGDLCAVVESGVPLGIPATVGGGAATPATPSLVPAGSLTAAFVAAVRHEKPMLAPTAAECSVEGPDDQGVVRVVLRTDRKMHVDRLASPEVRTLFTRVLTAACGKDVRVEFGAPSVAAQATSESHRAPPGARVQKVRERFDGDLIEPEGGSR
ncbi:MAG: DNA polymerase III subunit gamma/tau [Planctomycetota bacterium]